MRMYFSLLVQCVWTQVPLRLGNTCCPNSHPGFLIKTHHTFCVKHFFKNRAGCIFSELCEDIDSYCADHPKIQSWVCLPIKETTHEFSALDVWGRPDQKNTRTQPFPLSFSPSPKSSLWQSRQTGHLHFSAGRPAKVIRPFQGGAFEMYNSYTLYL